MAYSAQQVRLATAGIAEGQQILTSVYKRAVLEQFDLLAYSQGQTPEIEVLQRLFHR